MKRIDLGDNVDTVVEQTIETLKKGGLVIVPTDTVYGVAVDATNPDAVKKLIAFKSRVPGKAISVFVGSLEYAKEHVKITEKQTNLLKTLLPGAYTVILPSKHNVDKSIEAENGTLGIRIPDNDLCNKLVQKYERPVTATSANQAGRSSHHSVEALLNATPKNKAQYIDLIIDAGKLPQNKPSTVVDMSKDEVEVLREGDKQFTAAKKIEEVKSYSEEDTKELAKDLLNLHIPSLKGKPLVFMLTGQLGAGKTIFAKGLGEVLGVNNIVSPTFVIFYEYKSQNKNIDMFYHFDLYKIKEVDEFSHLGIEDMLKPRNVLCIEWSEKSGDILDLLKEKAHIIHVDVKHIDENSRLVRISE